MPWCVYCAQGLEEFVSVRVVHLENNCLRSCEGLVGGGVGLLLPVGELKSIKPR